MDSFFLLSSLVFTWLFAVQVETKIHFLPMRHEIRLHYNAPPDMWVTTIRAVDYDHPEVEIQYSLHEVQDHKYFRLDRLTGELFTSRHVFMKLGKTLTIMVVAYGQDEATLEQYKIEIVEYNRFTPEFKFKGYEVQVAYNVPINTYFLQVQATDNDSMWYNRELYYSLIPSNYTDFFSLNLTSGELRLKKKLSSSMNLIRLEVLAEDGGSPVRSATAEIKIFVKGITEPQTIHFQNPTGNTIKICWTRPAIGYVLGYLIEYREISRLDTKFHKVNATSRNITHEGSSFCTVLKNLHPWTDYEFRVYAWNNNEIGLGSNITIFGTTSNFCVTSPCKHGRCIAISGDPGFFCDCDLGFYGVNCSFFNPCVLRPCGDFGICHNTSDRSYRCNCLEGFSGMNCSMFDPCAISSTCANGGTCESDAPNIFRCICQDGFYGRTCSFYDPCFSKPCFNGASCINVSTIEYNCVCRPGFHGKQCEIDVDECISSPCFNGGTCIDRANGYGCRCKPGFTGVFCDKIDYCKEERTHLEHGVFYWPETSYGETVEIPCPIGAFDKKERRQVPTATRTCMSVEDRKLQWSAVDSSRCKEEGFVIAERVASDLQSKTSNPTQMNVDQLEEVTKQVENVVSYAVYDHKIAQTMLTVISNMLEVNSTVLIGDEESLETTERIVDVVKRFTSEVVIEKGQTVTFQTENLALQAAILDPEENNLHSMTYKAYHVTKPLDILENEHDPEDEEQVPTITIPKEALYVAALQNNEDVRVQFISFKNAKFFREKNASSSTEKDQQVLIATISNATISNLSVPVVYSMQSSTNLPQLCAYWKEEEKSWAFDGLTTNQSNGVVTCASTHMTAFTVLLDPDPNLELEAHHQVSLSIISYIGSALSIFGLTLTIFTYSLFRCLNRDRSGKILLSLCVSMLLMNLVFIIGSQSHGTQYKGLCVCVAVLIHYFLLTTLAWMCVEAINMYQMLVYVFASSETKFMLKRCLAAWGIPLIIVTITTGIDIGFYQNANEYCMLSPANAYVYYITFLGPSCFILLVNSVVFIMVTKVLFQPRVSGKVISDGRKKPQITFAQVRGAFTVMTLLGITWVFGAFAVGPAKVVMQYIFCILNSLQGFLIFIVRCVQYPEARAAWIQLFQSGTLKKYRGGFAASSSHSQSNGSKGLNFHSQSSRSASADTSSAYISSGSKERKLSVSSIMQIFRSGPRLSVVSLDRKSSLVSSPAKEAAKKRRASDGTHRKKKHLGDFEEQELKISVEKAPIYSTDSFSQRTPSIKEGRDTHWQYYCCSMKKPEEFQKELESQTITATPLLSVNPDDLPFIEDEPQEQKKKIESLSQSDQGYSSAENSPNSSRNISESNMPNISTFTTECKPIPEISDKEICSELVESTPFYNQKESIDSGKQENDTVRLKDYTKTIASSLMDLSSIADSNPWDRRMLSKQSRSMSELNYRLNLQRTKNLYFSNSVPSLHGDKPRKLSDANKPCITHATVREKNLIDPPSPNNHAKNVPKVVIKEFKDSEEFNKSEPLLSNSVNETMDIDTTSDSGERNQQTKAKHFLNSPKYNDALTVNSIENISYMDSSSVEGEFLM